MLLVVTQAVVCMPAVRTAGVQFPVKWFVFNHHASDVLANKLANVPILILPILNYFYNFCIFLQFILLLGTLEVYCGPRCVQLLFIEARENK